MYIYVDKIRSDGMKMPKKSLRAIVARTYINSPVNNDIKCQKVA